MSRMVIKAQRSAVSAATFVLGYGIRRRPADFLGYTPPAPREAMPSELAPFAQERTDAALEGVSAS